MVTNNSPKTSSSMMNVPDMIRDAAAKAGLDLSGPASQIGTSGAVPSEMVEAYKTGDYATIQRITDQTSNDLNPIYGNIQKMADKAFFQVVNPSDGVEYWLSLAGPTDNPYGYMWAYVPPSPAVEGSADAPVTQPVAQFGTFSVNSSTLGISNQLWDNSLAQLAAGAIATVVMTTVAKFIQKRIAGALTKDAVEAAVAEGGEALVAEGVVEVATWVSITAFVGGLIVGIVAGAIVFFLIMFIINFVYKAYKVAFNIYNWDINHSYSITDVYTDNAVIDGNVPFKVTEIPAPTNSFKMPDGLRVPTKDTIYQYASLCYDNDSQVFQGLGCGLRVTATDGSGSGFQLKYLCSRFGNNSIGLTGGLGGSIGDYYNDSDTWAASGSYSVQSTIPGQNVAISATTTALSGESDDFYQYDVHIGLKPSDKYGAPYPSPPQRAPLKQPEQVVMPGLGQEVKLPSGEIVKVISVKN